jgi:N-acetylmuramoyl-L-alanine amidase
MIIALLALQLAGGAARPERPIVVRDATRSVQVPVLAGRTGVPMLVPETLSPIVSVSVRKRSAVQYEVSIGGANLVLEPGLPFVRAGNELRPLAAAPEIRGTQLLVPLQLIAEVVPSVGTNLRWDAQRRELVLFSKATLAAAAQPLPTRQAAVQEVASRARTAPAAARSASRKPKRTIVVDAGHGGPDNGMTGPIGGPITLYEKDVTLAVAKRLGANLRSRGVNVVYTRTTDTLIALSDRGRIANRSEGDLFISVHVNAANLSWKDPAGARGFETYFLAEARTEDARRVEQMENESVRFEGDVSSSKDDPLNFIIHDMAQNEHLRESSELAEIIQRNLAAMHPGPNRGVKQAGFRVLVTAYMPAVLVEIGFGTNRAEADYLLNPQRQGAIASAIADAAMEYLQRYERRVGGSWQ